jgi:hypothetical protein
MLNNPNQGTNELQNLFRAALEERRGSTTFAPGKRQVKNFSGRTGRKQYHSQQGLKSVGGFSRPIDAIHASNTITVKNPLFHNIRFIGSGMTPAEYRAHPNNNAYNGQLVAPEFIEVPRPMCVVVSSTRGMTTTTDPLTGAAIQNPYRAVGGNTPGQNYIGGRGVR